MAFDSTLPHLASTPAIPPPPGVTPNFVNPETKAPGVIAALAIVLALTLAMLLTTTYAKRRTLGKFGPDDITAILGGIFNIATVSVNISTYARGEFGRHLWDIPRSVVINPEFLYRPFVTDVLGPWSEYFAKVTILLFLDTVFSRRRLVHTLVCAIVTIYTLFVVTLTMFVCIQCAPRGSPALFPDRCTNLTLFIVGDARAAFNAFIDIYALCLAVATILRLQMATRKKIGIALMLATGLIACGISVATLYYRVVTDKKIDFTWDDCTTGVLGAVEPMIALITARLPTLPMAWRYFFNEHSYHIRHLLPARIFYSRSNHSHTTSSRTKLPTDSSDAIVEVELGEHAKSVDTNHRIPTGS